MRRKISVQSREMLKSGSLSRMRTRSDAQELPEWKLWDEQSRMRYAEQIRPARQRAGKSQDQVAREAGVARNTVRAMEAGNGVPQAEKLWRVMLVLGLGEEEEAPLWLQEWWAIVRPLAERLPESRRGEVFGDIVMRLHRGIVEPLSAATDAAPSATVHPFPSPPEPEPVDEDDDGRGGLPLGAVAHRKAMTAEEEENRMLGFPSGEWEPS